MPAATNKADLLSVTQKEFAKLEKLISDIPDKQALTKREDDTSIKDVIGHRAHWIHLFLGWYADGQKGGPVAIPAEGYKWNQLKDYNAKLRANQADLSWHEVQAMLAKNHTKLLAFINSKDDAALYGSPMQGGGNNWTAGRWAEASGSSHYRSAAKWVRACLKSDKS